jgi:outer membrane protein assembly factor BamB
VAPKAKPPLNIGPTNNVRWCVDVAWSPSSPCVWGDHIFLTTFSDGELQTHSYSTQTGDLFWSRGIKPRKLETFHSTEGSPAASTPVTDGKRVVSYFGSVGLVCYDFKGKELWRCPMPVALSGGSYGSGTSPIIIGKRVILSRDQDANSSLVALDLANGKIAWETSRPDALGSFGTPIRWRNKGVDEVVVPGSSRLKGYDIKTGQERWLVAGLVSFDCTTPVEGDGLLFFAGWTPGKGDASWGTWDAFLAQYDKNHDGEIALEEFPASMREFIRGLDADRDGKITKADWDKMQARLAKSENLLVAVRSGGHGDITQTHVAWKATRGLPYVASPLFYDGRVYLIRDGGMMSSFDAKTGAPFYLQERLEAAESYYASPVAADGRIYVVSLPGRLSVIKAGGDKPEILHQANFGERVFATPALAGDRLYLRTQTKLYAF